MGGRVDGWMGGEIVLREETKEVRGSGRRELWSLRGGLGGLEGG